MPSLPLLPTDDKPLQRSSLHNLSSCLLIGFTAHEKRPTNQLDMFIILFYFIFISLLFQIRKGKYCFPTPHISSSEFAFRPPQALCHLSYPRPDEVKEISRETRCGGGGVAGGGGMWICRSLGRGECSSSQLSCEASPETGRLRFALVNIRTECALLFNATLLNRQSLTQGKKRKQCGHSWLKLSHLLKKKIK